ncbi:LegC family aminotransferase [Candidatus Cloacimonas acidaminovorans]|uniref:DegT/DnrJ/EryC1/StrS family protein n=1 Tax=Cloacimonas acidaminovorans (strain Evry) TaxID=459349 RepID=B0VGT4_CLOAI|nr:LegC family aminotransferase [Candidatus Cloacimonas acidaminovorans]CAO80543.1 DegT/DnrJ/EryC1/StrS family protein [Candidatus Cloacimonas acidaminovorans str. Evry]
MVYQYIIDFIRSLYPNRETVPLHEPYFGGNEKKYVLDCIESTFVSSVGKYVDRFEEMIKDFTGAKYAIATVNGTSALHIALKLAGVQEGDLVITQPLTFIATCNAISYCGAEPIFVDIDPDTLGMSPDSLANWLQENVELKVERVEEGLEGLDPQPSQLSQPSQPYKPYHKINKKRISACVPMHTFGHPCKMDSIVEICNRYHIPVVEDAAESIGSYYKGKHTGTFGKLGILSFNGNKTITTGGGGMILTDDDELGPLAKHLTTTAKKPHPWKFEHNMIGYNYRLPNINAALGCAQMEMLPEILKNKRETAHIYQDFFQTITDINFITEPEDCISNYWLNAILLKDMKERDAFLEQANAQKVRCRPAWILMNKLEMFNHCLTTEIPISEKIESKLVNVPSSYRNN